MFDQLPVIDLAILTRTHADLNPWVEAAIQAQRNVRLRIHRIVGSPHQSDRNRVETIVRARNQAVQRAQGKWLMFLDDDVVLGQDCIARLHYALTCRPNFGAFAADYLDDCGHRRPSPHVAMGATLFRTEYLPENPFRSEPDKCECLCRCLDMRRSRIRIEYLPGAIATHVPELTSRIPRGKQQTATTTPSTQAARSFSNPLDAKILVAFDRRDVKYFREVFLQTLRDAENHQEVVAIGYGLRPTETRILNRQQNVQVVDKPYTGQMAPIRRLRDFGDVVAQLPEHTPVAYWDAADVRFQNRLDPLWALANRHAGKLLAVREPLGYPENKAASEWSLSISDPQKRAVAFNLIASNPFLNSGFGAGTAAAMLRYFRTADHIRNSSDLQGTSDWGDQMAMNLYCHQDQTRWQEIPDTWNFCMRFRAQGSFSLSGEGLISCGSGKPVCAVHANGKSLRQLAIRS